MNTQDGRLLSITVSMDRHPPEDNASTDEPDLDLVQPAAELPPFPPPGYVQVFIFGPEAGGLWEWRYVFRAPDESYGPYELTPAEASELIRRGTTSPYGKALRARIAARVERERWAKEARQ